MATATPPYNLEQIHDKILQISPGVAPEGWGLLDENGEISDPTGTFSNAQIQAAIDLVVFDENYGIDADVLSLRDRAVGVLDQIIGGAELIDLTTQAGRDNLLLAVKRIAQIQRQILRAGEHVDESVPVTQV